MNARISQVYFFLCAFLIAGAVLSLNQVRLEINQPQADNQNQALNYNEEWPMATRLAYNFLYDDLENYAAQNNAITDEELNQFASDLVKKKGKKWALKTLIGGLGIGVNFGLFAGYAQIEVAFVQMTLNALTIAADVNFFRWLFS